METACYNRLPILKTTGRLDIDPTSIKQIKYMRKLETKFKPCN